MNGFHAVELKPDWAEAYVERGLVRLLHGRAHEAQQDFDRCLTLNRNLPPPLERLIEEARRQLATKR